LIDPATAERIKAHEGHRDKAVGLRWPVLLAISLGGVLLGAGVLLFVAAHWDALSPASRFALVLALVAAFHLSGGILAERFSALSVALHAVGTICLGAGIFLAGQIFHLQEHWPGALMLWALGAGIAWVLLRDWPQAAFTALLVPAWLTGEWLEATHGWGGREQILAEGLLLLAVTYLTGLLPEKETLVRKALARIGGVALIPLAILVIVSGGAISARQSPLPESYRLAGWLAAATLPLALAWVLRRGAAWMNMLAAVWIAALGSTSPKSFSMTGDLSLGLWHELGAYAMCMLGSLGLIAWGLKEASKERINLGMLSFALTVFFFYFSNVMDKLGRSASLIGLGLLFLLGGWLMEKTRRRLVARLELGGA
jgi:hypothetical protein